MGRCDRKAILMKVSRVRRMALALASTGTLAIGIPAVAHASFEAPYNVKCSGSVVEALTTRLQLPIARPWARSYFGGSSSVSCDGVGDSQLETGPTTSSFVLERLGSVNGERSATARGFSTEEPPTLAQWLNIDLGDKPGEDSGLVRQIPTAI